MGAEELVACRTLVEADRELIATRRERRAWASSTQFTFFVLIPYRERVQCLMRAAPWSEPVGEAEEVRLIDAVQHL